ncbi:MAG TPA: hypothetical protein VFO99_00660, partial [Pyrinomonadaceae bacterium]|nr:hypothetical protein [Pyrinomonadaceae bacterium]
MSHKKAQDVLATKRHKKAQEAQEQKGKKGTEVRRGRRVQKAEEAEGRRGTKAAMISTSRRKLFKQLVSEAASCTQCPAMCGRSAV